ncbi:MAG TPA: succinate dehydrogenase, cytochrome b556 subunit [Steroidobacteraceae bacterium]|jgi:succinate dehydrogenase / fumarate reductase cytochrome b subunit|nr:succinate dehydrogenase, cytochrome b556 subunit [Steroidobacteraceae bacterium]
MRARPLSPHMTIYRMSRYSMLSSFANRVTGAALSAGLVLFIYWLTALARGARAYARAQEVLGSGVAKVLYVALIAAFCYHLVAGVRHLIWDTGHGLEKAQSQRSAWLVIGAAVLLTMLCARWAFRAREGL